MTDDPRAAAFEQALTDEVLFDAFCVVADVTPYWENVTSAAVVEMRAVLVAALLKAAPPAEGPTWQPIETAPKDADIFAWSTTDDQFDVVHWDEGGHWWGNGGCDYPFKATHWMPLPTPPRDPAGKE